MRSTSIPSYQVFFARRPGAIPMVLGRVASRLDRNVWFNVSSAMDATLVAQASQVCAFPHVGISAMGSGSPLVVEPVRQRCLRRRLSLPPQGGYRSCRSGLAERGWLSPLSSSSGGSAGGAVPGSTAAGSAEVATPAFASAASFLLRRRRAAFRVSLGLAAGPADALVGLWSHCCLAVWSDLAW